VRIFLALGFLVLGIFSVGEGILLAFYGVRSFWATTIQIPQSSRPTVLSIVAGMFVFAAGIGFLYLSAKAFPGRFLLRRRKGDDHVQP
jgi:fucose permease